MKALALDLDGTLTNSQKKITPRTCKAVMASAEKGISIILASGRPVLGIKPIALELGLYDKGGYILAYNGGRIIDCTSNKVIYEKLLPMRYYPAVCQTARELGLHALTYDSEGVLAESDTAPYVKKEAYNNSIPIRVTDCLEKAVSGEVVKFMIVGESELISKAAQELKIRTNGEINVFLSEPYFMEITALGIEKASALAHLAKYLKIEKDEICAIGDGLNDKSMLEYAGLAVAMGNAYEEIKELADYITDNNDNDGVAVFIESWLNLC